MGNYDSDSSDGGEQDYTETNVLLGYASKEASESDDVNSYIGGRPVSSPSTAKTTHATLPPSSPSNIYPADLALPHHPPFRHPRPLQNMQRHNVPPPPTKRRPPQRFPRPRAPSLRPHLSPQNLPAERRQHPRPAKSPRQRSGGGEGGPEEGGGEAGAKTSSGSGEGGVEYDVWG